MTKVTVYGQRATPTFPRTAHVESIALRVETKREDCWVHVSIGRQWSHLPSQRINQNSTSNLNPCCLKLHGTVNLVTAIRLLFSQNRAPKEIALCPVYPQFTENISGIRIFDKFGYRGQLQIFCDITNAFDDLPDALVFYLLN